MQYRKDDYRELVAKLCSKAEVVETSDLLLYSFGCHLKEFLEGYTVNMSTNTKYVTFSRIKDELWERIMRKVFDVI